MHVMQLLDPGVTIAIVLTAGQAALAQAQPVSPELEPTVPAAAGSRAPGDGEPDVVDESALRYFARTGDQERLEAETARLRALHPDWVPPEDPLAAAPSGDPKLDGLWRLFSEGRLAETRTAIAQRESDEAGWAAPADLLDQLSLAEARIRLMNASDLGQSRTVVDIAAETPRLLNCQDVDLLWRLAAAFSEIGRVERAVDAYGYVLDNCGAGQVSLATMQKALATLDRAGVETLLAREIADPQAGPEFASIRLELSRQAIAAASAEGAPAAAVADLDAVGTAFASNARASDALLLAWHDYRHGRLDSASAWFRRAQEAEATADAATGLALVAIAGRDYVTAEASLHGWRDASDQARATYLAAAANLLAGDPPPAIDESVLARIVPAVVAAKDATVAQQLGWYSRAFNQFETAAQWFETALAWNAADEPAAFGLALTRHDLGASAALAEVKRAWSGRSDRIAAIGDPVTDAAARPVAQPSEPAAPAAGSRPLAGDPRTSAAGTGCRSGAPLATGWCLLDANRPLEAASAFEAALASGSDATRRDAAYGQSLAYLRLGLADQAALAAVRVRQTPERAAELQTSILAERAITAFQTGRHGDAIIALDQRARIARERVDLMVLRGYAYLKLNRRRDALRIFEAAAGTGNQAAVEGLQAARRQVRAGR